MFSASNGLESIARASASVRTDEDRLSRILEAATAEIARLQADDAELFRALGRLRLDALRQERVLAPLSEAERRARDEIADQRRQLDSLTERRQTLRATLDRVEDERRQKADRVQAAADALSDLRTATRARLSGEVAWQAAVARLSGVRELAAAARDKAARAAADRDEKSKPYLADRLFRYLWERGYGTPAYRGSVFTRWGDAYVARVVNFAPARQDFFSLTEIPKRLQEHAARLAEALAAEEQRQTALERAALEADGVAAPEATYAAAEAALAEVDHAAGDLEQAIARVDAERDGLLGEKGLASVLADLTSALGRTDLRDLLDAARQTPTPDDDRIVRQLQENAAARAKQDGIAAEARQTLLALARKRAELDRARDEFRRYERAGGGFSNDRLIGDIIGGILAGVLSSRELRDALRSGHRPRSGSSGGDWGGGGFGTGGGFGGSGGSRGGGGFSTGGGF